MTREELDAIRHRCEAAKTYPLHNRRHSLVDGKTAPGEGPCAACAFEDHAKEDVLSLLAYIATLEADLRACAEALLLMDDYHDEYPLEISDSGVEILERVGQVLARPGVQAVLGEHTKEAS